MNAALTLLPNEDERRTQASSIEQQGALLKVPAVAQRLNVSPWRAYDLIAKGHLQAVRLGRAVRVSPRALEFFIQSGGTATSGDDA